MSEVSIYMAFAAGLISFLSPCVLPLVPGYIAFISGVTFEEIRTDRGNISFWSKEKRVVLLNSIFFVVGFSILFILMGASATWLGATLLSKLPLLSKIGGLIIIFFGIHMMGFMRVNLFYKDARFHIKGKKFGYFGAALIGASFAFGWTPCFGPILGGILAYASMLEKVNQGIFLLAIYSMGLGIPFLLTAVGLNHFLGIFNRIKKYFRFLEVSSGAVMVILGVMIYTDKLVLIPGYLSFLDKFSW